MPQLSLTFLGGFEVTLEAEPVTAFGAEKARALLAYLAIESHRPHRRAELAAMFWPDLSEKKASHNLSQSLLRLRTALGEKKHSRLSSFVVITPQDIQFNINSDYQLDVTRFRELLKQSYQHTHPEGTSCPVCMQRYRQAAELYRGDLLSGLLVPDSVTFEEWRLVQQEELHHQALEVLGRLASHDEQRGEYGRVQEYVRRQIALEPWREEAHLQLMRALAKSGQSSAALKQYEIYKNTLELELGVRPSIAVTRYYEQIRAGKEPASTTSEPGAEKPVWSPSQGERRQITTLVCSQAVEDDPDHMIEGLADCQRHCTSIFHRFGGRRARRQGSKCLVFFGFPQAYEDAARRAVHAGLAATKALDESAPLRIGIHTGFMTIGERQGRRWQDRDLVGTAPEIARDTQWFAGPGEVVISEETRRLIEGSFDLKRLKPQTLGASRTPLQVYQVRGETGAQGRLAWLARTQRLTSFAGRAKELAHLNSSLEKARAGQGQVVLLRGESGIGKSRLVWELQHGAAGAASLNPTEKNLPMAWLSSHCLPHNQNTSLFPVIGLLEGLLDFTAEDRLDTRREKLATVLGRYGLDRPSSTWLLSLLLGLPMSAPVPDMITNAQREQMRKIFLVLLQKRAAEGPLAVVIEDLHWSDPSTLHWLSESIESLAATPCLVVLTARPAFDLAWLSREKLLPGTVVLNLNPLHVRESAEMVNDLAGEGALNEETRHQIVMHADGNPLFVEELTKSVLEEPGPRRGTQARMVIPATLLDPLSARLDHLGPAKETIQWCAALGREFSHPILKACTAYDEQRLQADLAHLVENEFLALIDIKDPSRYIFKHALIQETAYTSMLIRTRQIYHRRIAETMELHFPQLAETRPEILAQHYANADAQGKAVDFWIRAGEQSTLHGATQEAGSFYDRAIHGIEPRNHEQMWRALMGRETVLFYQGKRTEQKADIEALLHLAEEMGDAERRAQAYLRQARYTTSQSDYRGQLESAEAAIEAASHAGATNMEVEAWAYEVTALLRLGERAAAQEAVENTLAHLQRLEDDSIWSYAMAAVAVYYIETGDLARAAKSLMQSLEAARRSRVRHLDLEAQYHGHLGYTYSQLGLYAQARAVLETGLELADLMGITRFQAYHRLNLGVVYWRLGDFATAIQMEEQALREYLETGEAFGQAASHAYLGYICEATGDLPLAAHHLAAARTGFGSLGADADKFEAQAAEARVALAQGRVEDAKQFTAEVWKYLGEEGTDGLGSPAWVYACIADVLRSIDIPDVSVRDAIEAGYHDLVQKGEKISDPDWRRSFLESVPENRAIMERWRELNRGTGMV